MFRVVTVTDKKNSAIDRITRGMVKYMDNIEYIVCDVHPKRPDPKQLEQFRKAIVGADIIDFQYFKTARMLLNTFPELKGVKRILTHHNPYSISEEDWNDFDVVVANNLTIHENLKDITNAELKYIGNTIDTDFWTFKRDWKPRKQAIMVAARIDAKKGVLPVALACQELGIPLHLVGSISDRNYFNAVMATNVVHFHENISDEHLRDLYWESMVHVCNSVDNFESGTQPILEAMLTGVPVITRSVGHVPDLDNGENMIVRKGDSEDIEDLIDQMQEVLSNESLRKSLREKAWDTAKVRSHERRAWLYQMIYREMMSEEPSVSVVMPIHTNEAIIKKAITAVLTQDYPNLELVVCDDGDNKELIDSLKPMINRPIRYIHSNQGDYGLARARNLGVINATGDIIVFCDQRIEMKPDAVSQFASAIHKNVWLFGDKNGKKNFVENFSCIMREDIIKMGLFNERINLYGGQSQELRERARRVHIETKYHPAAKATPLGTSKNKQKRRSEIIKMKNMLWRMGL